MEQERFIDVLIYGCMDEIYIYIYIYIYIDMEYGRIYRGLIMVRQIS